MNWQNFTFRCSSLGLLMTNPRSGNGLSETAQKELLAIWIEQTYGRKRDIVNKYTTKGLEVEEDSITLLSRVKKRPYFKNETRLQNEIINGLPDLYEGKTITSATRIIDCKSSWDLQTFFAAEFDNVKKEYYWQMQGYMLLTGAQTSTLAYCLVNTPETLINDEKRRLAWRMGVASDDNPIAQEAFAQLDKNMTFDDIPLHERLHEKHVEFNPASIELLEERVPIWRQWLTDLTNSRNITQTIKEALEA